MNMATYPVVRAAVWSGELFCDTVISVAVPVYCVPECRTVAPKATNPASSAIAATRNRRLQIRARCAPKLIGMLLPRCLLRKRQLPPGCDPLEEPHRRKPKVSPGLISGSLADS